MLSLGVFLNITTLKRNEITERLRFFRQLKDINHIEVWLEHGYWSADDSRWLRKELDGLNCIVHAPFIQTSLIGTHQPIIDASYAVFKRVIDLSALLNCKVLTIHLGRKPAYMSNDDTLESSLVYIDKLLRYIDGRMKLSVENLPQKGGAYTSYPTMLSEVEKILAHFPNLSATVDIGHCIRNDDNYINFFTKYTEKIADIHLHNAQRKGNEHFGFNKKGDVKLQPFINFLKKVNYQGYLTLEIFGEDEDIKTSWLLLKKYLDKA